MWVQIDNEWILLTSFKKKDMLIFQQMATQAGNSGSHFTVSEARVARIKNFRWKCKIK